MKAHSEVKLAWKLRREGQSSASIVINNEMCDRQSPMPFAPYGCRRAIRAILPKGYTLNVWEPEAAEPTTIRGVADS